MVKLKMLLLVYIPRTFAVCYSTAMIAWWAAYHALLPYWHIWLLMVGAVYALKDFLLGGRV